MAEKEAKLSKPQRRRKRKQERLAEERKARGAVDLWCYFCDRDFGTDEQGLVLHQRQKHYKCTEVRGVISFAARPQSGD